MICYTTNLDEYRQIYDHYCTYDREYVPHFIAASDSSYYNIYNDDNYTDREIVSSLSLKKDFKCLMNWYRTNITNSDSSSKSQIIPTCNIIQEQSITPYNPNQQQIVDFNLETKISHTASYPEFYKKSW